MDQTWLNALRNGDEQALRSIFDHYYKVMLNDAYRLVPDVGVCKDLVQDVFVELWRKRTAIDVHTSLGAYLRRAAVNRALNYLKANQALDFGAESELVNTADTAPQELEQREAQEVREAQLYRAIDQLPEKCRLVFAMSRFEQLSHKEIAERLDISVKTIENQITKAMKMLREALAQGAKLSPVVIWFLKWWENT